MFDAGDIDYMVKNLTSIQLIRNINRAKAMGWDEDVQASQLALDILRTYEPEHTQTIGKQTESIESIKARIEIVDYIGQYVVLKKSGNKFMGVCPFHSEKKGSFFVMPNTQTWHCFGACNTGGDIITFVQKYEHIGVKEVIQRLAK
jgi:hypothetical protein